MTKIHTMAHLGTEIFFNMYLDNPVKETADKPEFLDGYFEIVVRCNGRNPCFPKKDWSILIVNSTSGQPEESIVDSEAGIITIIVEYNSIPIKVRTCVSSLQKVNGDGAALDHALIWVEILSHEGKLRNEIFICHDVAHREMITSTLQ